jgi:hypothetical protein
MEQQRQNAHQYTQYALWKANRLAQTRELIANRA